MVFDENKIKEDLVDLGYLPMLNYFEKAIDDYRIEVKVYPNFMYRKIRKDDIIFDLRKILSIGRLESDEAFASIKGHVISKSRSMRERLERFHQERKEVEATTSTPKRDIRAALERRRYE